MRVHDFTSIQEDGCDTHYKTKQITYLLPVGLFKLPRMDVPRTFFKLPRIFFKLPGMFFKLPMDVLQAT